MIYRSLRFFGLSKPFFFYFLLVPAFWITGCSPAPEASFSLQSAVDLPAGTPITLNLPDGFNCCEGVSIRSAGGSRLAALQPGGPGEAVFTLREGLEAGSSKQFDIVKAPPSNGAAGLQVVETDTGLEVTAGDQKIFTYNTATLMPPEGLPDYYKRSGFIHPLYSPKGKILTDGFPEGHTHQHGIFFAWVNTTYRGEFTDFWNQQKETGTVALVEVNKKQGGHVFAEIQSEHEYLSLKHGRVLTEEWTVRAYRQDRYNILDITSRQKLAGEDTLFLNKYHYGGMAVRMAAEWNEADSMRFSNPMQVLTSQGITHPDSANHSRPNWTAAFGTLEGEAAGVALFDNPANFRFPQPVRVHPNMPYFVLTPMVEEAFMLLPGQEYSSTYRLVSYDGAPDPEELEAMWRAYTAEVAVRVFFN